MNDPRVTICIPTWQSEEFIDETLNYARNQTHTHLHISVSIDQSGDRTEEICQRHAREDDRVEVFTQKVRLGWARNINFLLDNVASEYFFLYMHDDIIDPRYTEKLLSRLRQRPDAASVQCDVLNVSSRGEGLVSRGRAHEGSVSERVIASLVGPLGAPLRSLIRTEVARDGLRFPATSRSGYHAQVPFQAEVFSAGPALHVPEILYWRPYLRKGGLTDSWHGASVGELIADEQVNAEQCIRLIERCDVSASKKTMMQFALYINLLRRIRSCEIGQRAASLVDPSVVSPAFKFGGIPSTLSSLPTDVQQWIVRGYVNLVRKESLHYLRKGDFKNALARLGTLSVSDAINELPSLPGRGIRKILRRLNPVKVPADVRARLAH